jgi:F-type H+-transporting ATPase subunit c
MAQEQGVGEALQGGGAFDWGPGLGVLGTAIGVGLVIGGAAYGISRVGGAAVENMARQPEVAGNIQTAMLIAAALIEGVTFFALIVLLIAVFRV